MLKEINSSKINAFLSQANNVDEIKNNSLFKVLNVSEPAFVLLQYFCKTYLLQGVDSFVINQVIRDLNNSKIINEILGTEISSKKDDSTDIIPFEGSSIDLLLNEKFINLDLSNYIFELINMGYIYPDNFDISDIEKGFDLFNTSCSINSLLFDIIETDGSFLKTNIRELKQGYDSYADTLNDFYEYLDIKTKYYLNKNKLSEKSPILSHSLSTFNKLRLIIEKNIDKTSISLPIVEFSNTHNLTSEQEDLIILLYKEDENKNETVLKENLMYMFYGEKNPVVSSSFLFDMPEEMFETDYSETNVYTSSGDYKTIEKIYFFLHSETYDSIKLIDDIEEINIEEKKNVKKKVKTISEVIKKSNILELVEPTHDLDDIILYPDTKKLVKNLMESLTDDVVNILKEWWFKNDDSIKSLILFDGLSGTGKTATAHAIAKSLKRPIISLDCSKLLSMYVGESEKNVKSLFDEYRNIVKKTDIHPVLLLNEADQFLSSRVENSSSGSDKMHNQMQNIFLEEMEKFEGILIATTNLVKNIDKAFSRRFDRKIEFKMPNKEQRKLIWEMKIGKKLPLDKSFNFNELSSLEVTGGQIDIAVKNTVYDNAVHRKMNFETSDFINFTKKEMSSSFNSNNKIGFFD